MTTPNNMPKRPNKLRQQIVGDLIHTTPSSWERKTLSKNEEGKEVVSTTKVTNNALRYALAQNVSEESVERLARRWL